MFITESHRAMMRNYGTLIARLLVGILFILAGLGKVGVQYAGTVKYIASTGIPFPEVLAVLSAVVEIAGGLSLILGWYMSYSTLALAVFVLLTSIFFHSPSTWAQNPVQQIMFLKNFALIGGLFYMFAYGPGESLSVDNRHTFRKSEEESETPEAPTEAEVADVSEERTPTTTSEPAKIAPETPIVEDTEVVLHEKAELSKDEEKVS